MKLQVNITINNKNNELQVNVAINNKIINYKWM